jgi:hypothetical protein
VRRSTLTQSSPSDFFVICSPFCSRSHHKPVIARLMETSDFPDEGIRIAVCNKFLAAAAIF